ncbi:hypothetical protein CBR_g19572 [Chara braunii]|uniref:DDE Tnp4 domain-containing protein n=1 Tax=Chara braunii TaxID=69332 RepID=A0A388KYC8_CHABU|nr:hypothetical protein CBR_g19572 [Chara braunii]|eukprot:GBG75059.1 hypothetical protein CBR_g19572 [Chara braunii]
MDVNGDAVHDTLSKAERGAVAAAVNLILIRCQLQRTEGRMRAAIHARWKKMLQSMHVDEEGSGAICDAVLQVCYAMGCGAFPRATLRWWMKRRTGGVWEDLRQCDDATEDYFKKKLRMSPRVFREIAEALSSFLQRRVTFYREPLQPDLIVAYALNRWVSGETYESGICSFGIGRKFGLVAVRDVTSALLSAYPEKISWPTGLRKAVVLRAFTDNGFPNCNGCIDCTHIFIDKPANCPDEDYYDRKRRFFVQAQVVVDVNLRVLDVFVGYPGSCHDVRIVHLSSLWARAEAEKLFTGPPIMLPFSVRTNGYLLGDNGYPPSEWVVVPYDGLSQHSSEMQFDNKQKTARGAVERAFDRLKGMWRLFLRSQDEHGDVAAAIRRRLHSAQHTHRRGHPVRRQSTVGGRAGWCSSQGGPWDAPPIEADVHGVVNGGCADPAGCTGRTNGYAVKTANSWEQGVNRPLPVSVGVGVHAAACLAHFSFVHFRIAPHLGGCRRVGFMAMAQSIASSAGVS